MTDLREMLVRLKGDSSSLTSSVAGADKSLRSLGETGKQVSAGLQSAYAKVGEATKRVEVAQAQAALAMQKAQTAAHDDSLSLEQVVLASTKADLAAERVTTAQANVATAMERTSMVARQEAQAEVQVAEKAEMAGRSLRESFSAGLSRVSEAGSGFIGRVRGMGSSLVGFLGAAGDAVNGIQMLGQTAQWLGQALIGQNASMEQTRVAFIQLLGSAKAADAELKDLQQFAASTPFEFPELADATQKLLAFQFNLKDTKPLLTAIGDALSGLGKNNAATLEEVVHVFGQMHSTTHLMTGDLMQLTSVGINGFQILADQMHKPVSVIRDMVEQGLIPANDGIEMLRKGMEKTFGPGMQKQSETFNGLLSTFQDNISAAWRAFTGPLFETAKGALTDLGNLVSSDQFQNFAKTMGEKVGGALKAAGEAIGGVVAAIKSPEFAKLGETLGRIFGPLVAAIEGPFKSAMQTLQGAKTSDITNGLRQAATAANDFLTALEGFQGGSSQFSQAGQSIHDAAVKIGEVLKQVGDFLVTTFTPNWLQLADAINYQVIPSWYSLTDAMGPLLPALQHLGEATIAVVAAIVQSFARLLGQATEAAGGVIQAFTGAFEIIAGHAAIFVDLMNGNFGRIGEDLPSIWDGIKLLFIGALNSLNLTTFGFVDGILSLFGTSVPKLTSTWINGGNQMKKSASDTKTSVNASFSDMSSHSLTSVQTLSDGAIALLKQLGDNGTSIMRNMDQDATAYWNHVNDLISQWEEKVNVSRMTGAQRHQYYKGQDINGGYAEGGDVPVSGMYKVGERGPEIVALPGGAHVYPHGVNPMMGSMAPTGSSSQSLGLLIRHLASEIVSQLRSHEESRPVYLVANGQVLAEVAGDHQARMTRLHQARRTA